MWKYRCYITNVTPNLWGVWYAENPDANGAHDSVFRMLEQQISWGRPHSKKLIGKAHKGLFEVIVKCNLQWRIFGFFERDRTYVVTAIGYHKGKVYKPRAILETATKRMNEIKADNSKAARCERPT